VRLSLIAVVACLTIGAGPALAQTEPAQLAPIPNAGGWMIASPGQATECSARLNGAQIDTILTVNNDGRLVLIAGRPDWRGRPGKETVTLQVDALPARHVSGDHVANLFMVLVADDALLKDVEGARQLTWTFKVGKFKASVTGLGAAFEAAKACKASLPAEPS